ncbi:MAG TPA: VOC family protein [Thermoanaerobaculia bacterium]|nr:VOC family protein [Thermoanaerobaculia bacterium]
MLRNAAIRAYIPASDVARARKFYEEKVGLEPREVYAGGVIYECGDTEVFMYPTANAGTSKASQAYWQVDDVEAEVADLEARGVKFEHYDMPGAPMKDNIATGGGAKTAWFKDSEGEHPGRQSAIEPSLNTGRKGDSRPSGQPHMIAR